MLFTYLIGKIYERVQESVLCVCVLCVCVCALCVFQSCVYVAKCLGSTVLPSTFSMFTCASKQS